MKTREEEDGDEKKATDELQVLERTRADLNTELPIPGGMMAHAFWMQ